MLVVVAAGLAGCGGGARAMPPEEFADSTCKAFGAFAEDVSATLRGEELRSILSGETSPESLDGLGDVFGKIRASIGRLAADIEGLGPPDVEGGKRFQEDLVAALRTSERLTGSAIAKFERIDTASDVPEVAAAVVELGKALEEADLDLTVKAPPELSRAFEDSGRCREVERRLEDAR
jgi:hypothetical protein